jgi:elongation factor G
LTIPIGSEAGFSGVVDLVKGKGFSFAEDESGKLSECDMPDDMSDTVSDLRQKLIEDIAETSEELLEKYLEGQELSEEEMLGTIAGRVKDGSLTCLMCGAAVNNFGVSPLLDFIVQYFPSPLDRPEVEVTGASSEEPVKLSLSPDEPFFGYVFKTISDPYAGKLSIFRVFSGQLSADGTVYNANKKVKEKVSQLLSIEGKSQTPVDAAVPGDIVAIAKLKDTATGDSLCDEKRPVCFKGIEHPRPVTSYAVIPKTRADEDKLATAFARLMEEDPTLDLRKNEETNEFVLSGIGQIHLDVAAARLKRKYSVDIEMTLPKIAYREAIKGQTKIQGKHKKQTGGRGQFADTWIEIAPLPRGSGFEFADKIVGGAIPKNYIPAVEKGIANQMKEGILAGYPIVDVKVTLYDGSFHEVDSSDMAFQIAGSKGFKTGFMQCNPVLLEPVMNVEVTVPDDMTGDVMGDLNSRRGRVLGMEPTVGGQLVRAQVPLAEMLTYSAELTAMTSGRGMFTMEFDHYEEVPQNLSEKIIEASQAEKA